MCKPHRVRRVSSSVGGFGCVAERLLHLCRGTWEPKARGVDSRECAARIKVPLVSLSEFLHFKLDNVSIRLVGNKFGLLGNPLRKRDNLLVLKEFGDTPRRGSF